MANNKRASEEDIALEAIRELGRLDSDDDEKIDFHKYWHTILKHKWGIISLTIIAAVASMLYATSLEPRYEASATIQFDPSSRNYGTVEDTATAEAYRIYRTSQMFETQKAVMSSRNFAEKIVDRLELWKNPYFDPTIKKREPCFFAG